MARIQDEEDTPLTELTKTRSFEDEVTPLFGPGEKRIWATFVQATYDSPLVDTGHGVRAFSMGPFDLVMHTTETEDGAKAALAEALKKERCASDKDVLSLLKPLASLPWTADCDICLDVYTATYDLDAEANLLTVYDRQKEDCVLTLDQFYTTIMKRAFAS